MLDEEELIDDDDYDEVASLGGVDDDLGSHYSVFNPTVDFKGKINLTLGLIFVPVTVLRRH